MTTEIELCKPCQIARTVPTYPFFNLGCLHCGARIIQHLATLPIVPSQVAERRRENLAHWVAFGHSEADLRALAKGPLAIGPGHPLAPESPALPKRR